MGPVQVLVVRIDQPTLNGEVLTELTRLRAAGIVRLVDLLLVSRHEDGALETLDMPPSVPKGLGGLTAALLGRDHDEVGKPARGPATDRADEHHTTWSLADAVPVGSVVAVALIEHVWAEPLRDAIRRTGGTPVDETWLAADDVEQLRAMLADT